MKQTAWLVAFGVLTAVPAFAQDAAQVARGQKVYADQRCAVCHSIGTTGNRRGPLDDVGSRLSADELRQWMLDAPGMTAKTKSERKPAMRSYPNLPAADLDALVAYMMTLKK